MTLLVTGATGHVGLAVVKAAAARGMPVIALYRTAPCTDPTIAGADVRWVQCALDERGAVAAVAAQYPIDACIHTAAISNEAYARPHPLVAIHSNVGAVANLLDAARQYGWRRVVNVGTGSVFQRRTDAVTPILEDEAPCPGNIYSTTKAAAEMIVRLYRDEFDMSAATVRISWVYGPPVVSLSPARGPIPSFLIRTLRGQVINETGGDFAASFTYVDDIANALLAASAAVALRHPVYHFGHGKNFSAYQAADAVREAVAGARLSLEPGTSPWTKFTAIRAPLAGNLFDHDIGYRPVVSLQKGIQRYAAWLQQHPQLLATAEA